MKPNRSFVLSSVGAGAWVAAVGLTARIGISLRTGYDEYRYEHYLPFLAAWAVVTACTAIVIGPRLIGHRRMALAVVAVTVLAAGLYYAIGRPFEIRLLRDQTQSRLSGTFFDPRNELLLPLLMGVIPAAMLSVIFGLIGRGGRHVSTANVSRSDTFITGLATYLAIGCLLWLQAAAAWVLIGLWTGSHPSPAADPWIRFADEASPQYTVWYLTAWPWLVVACCG